MNVVTKRAWVSRVRANEQRECARCLKVKSKEDFYVARGSRANVCKPCAKDVTHEYRKLHLVETRTTMRKSYRKNWLKRAVDRARVRAEILGISFNILVEDVVVPERCPVLGVKLEIGAGLRSPSLDRIDPKKGYVRGNVAIISMRANAIKNDATIEEHEAVIAWMRKVK